MSKQEWKKIAKDKYEIKIGPAVVTIEAGKYGWYTILWDEKTYLPMTASLEDDQAAALAWARSVLGKALVEAGAEQEVLYRCSKCDCLADVPVACYCADGETSQEIYARIEGA